MTKGQITQVVENVLAAIEDPDVANKIKKAIPKVGKAATNRIVQIGMANPPEISVKMTALQYAAFCNRYEVARYLIQKYKVDVNLGGEPDMDFGVCYRNLCHTPLGFAVLQNHYPTVKKLYEEMEASVNVTPDEMPNVVHIASYNGNYYILKFLLDRGSKNYTGVAEGVIERPGFMITVHKGFEQLVRLYLDKKVPINDSDRFGHTPLHIAVKQDNLSMVKLLFESGAEVYEDVYGLTPLQIACLHKHEDMVKYLIEYLEENGKLKRLEKVLALELLGAALGIYSGYKYLCDAWRQRYSPDQKILEKAIVSPQKCYDLQSEHETLKQLGYVYQEKVCDLGKFKFFNELQEKESLVIMERIIGPDNPYIALFLERIMWFYLKEGKSQRFLMFVRKQLETLHLQQKSNSLCSIWIETALLLIDIPKVTQNVSFIRQLDKLTRNCAVLFMKENVWVDYGLEDWLKDFNEEQECENDLVLDNTVATLFHLIHHLPEVDEKWDDVTDIASRFIALCSKYISKAKCTKSALHSLFTVDIWDTYLPEMTIHTVRTLIEVLLKAGLNVNVRDRHKNSALHLAAKSEAKWYIHPLIRILKENKAHLDVRNRDNQTAYRLYMSRFKVPETKDRASKLGRVSKMSKVSIADDVPEPDTETVNLLKYGVDALQCMCARIIRENKIKYKHKLNKKLRLLVNTH